MLFAEVTFIVIPQILLADCGADCTRQKGLRCFKHKTCDL